MWTASGTKFQIFASLCVSLLFDLGLTFSRLHFLAIKIPVHSSMAFSNFPWYGSLSHK